MFNKAQYKVFKTGQNTEEMYFETEYDTDDYGRSTSWQKESWRKFQSDLYYLEAHYNHAQTMYSNFKLNYYPVAPSGNYNSRYSSLYQKTLRNLDYVGVYDGENFDFEIPYLYTSLHELQPLDVFTLESDYSYRDGIWKTDPILHISKSTELVLENFDDMKTKLFQDARVSEVNTKKMHKLHGDLRVNKIGRIILKREFEKL